MYSLDTIPNSIGLYGFIYLITNTINGKVYIGQTKMSVNRRFGMHCRSDEIVIGKAIKKYGKENFKVEIIGTANSLEELDNLEISLIAQYKEFYILYNVSLGGNGHKVVSEETKKKISESHKGKKKSPEHVEKVRQFHIGRKLTLEQTIRVRQLRTEKNGKRIFSIDINGNISYFDGIRQAGRLLNIPRERISKCLTSGDIVREQFLFFTLDKLEEVQNSDPKKLFTPFYIKNEKEIKYFKSIRQVYLHLNVSERCGRDGFKKGKILNYEFGKL